MVSQHGLANCVNIFLQQRYSVTGRLAVLTLTPSVFVFFFFRGFRTSTKSTCSLTSCVVVHGDLLFLSVLPHGSAKCVNLFLQ